MKPAGKGLDKIAAGVSDCAEEQEGAWEMCKSRVGGRQFTCVFCQGKKCSDCLVCFHCVPCNVDFV